MFKELPRVNTNFRRQIAIKIALNSPKRQKRKRGGFKRHHQSKGNFIC